MVVASQLRNPHAFSGLLWIAKVKRECVCLCERLGKCCQKAQVRFIKSLRPRNTLRIVMNLRNERERG